MGLGQLKDAAVRERRRRLLGDGMVAAARRRPSRAQLGALVDDREGGQTHSHLAAATATSDEEARTLETFIKGRPTYAHLAATATTEGSRGLETLMMGRLTNALHSSPTVAGKFMMEAPCKLGNMLDGVEGLIDGEWRTHGRAVTAPNEEAGGLETDPGTTYYYGFFIRSSSGQVK